MACIRNVSFTGKLVAVAEADCSEKWILTIETLCPSLRLERPDGFRVDTIRVLWGAAVGEEMLSASHLGCFLQISAGTLNSLDLSETMVVDARVCVLGDKSVAHEMVPITVADYMEVEVLECEYLTWADCLDPLGVSPCSMPFVFSCANNEIFRIREFLCSSDVRMDVCVSDSGAIEKLLPYVPEHIRSIALSASLRAGCWEDTDFLYIDAADVYMVDTDSSLVLLQDVCEVVSFLIKTNKKYRSLAHCDSGDLSLNDSAISFMQRAADSLGKRLVLLDSENK